ncbi:hypothetical protein [Streptomyces sp. I05A-00742]|uniref:hypothetical protein n=1 Tax=Streptomyces sp. I05A-00742 TaxID=2732853 RepID=UPI0014892457|nr:hypothetical protein [Streptomyces sp. I05A-00742]
MAMPRKGSRRITVDGIAYRWRVRHRPTYDQAVAGAPLTYAVEQAESPGTTLVVTAEGTRPDGWFGAPSVVVTPSTVAEVVRTARSRGWTPERPGPSFHLDCSVESSPSAA